MADLPALPRILRLGSVGRDVRALQRAYVEVWVDTLLRLHPDLPAESARVAAHGAFGLLNSTPYTSPTADPARVADVLRRMAHAALTVQNARGTTQYHRPEKRPAAITPEDLSSFVGMVLNRQHPGWALFFPPTTIMASTSRASFTESSCRVSVTGQTVLTTRRSWHRRRQKAANSSSLFGRIVDWLSTPSFFVRGTRSQVDRSMSSTTTWFSPA